MLSFSKQEAQESNTIKVLPVGEYECVISEAKVDKTSKGDDCIKLTLTIRPEHNVNGGGRKIFDMVMFTENTKFKFLQLGDVLGWEDQEFENHHAVANALRYQAVRVKTKNEEYEGKTNAKVSFYKAATVPYAGAQNSEDPFASDGRPIDISDDDLPF